MRKLNTKVARVEATFAVRSDIRLTRISINVVESRSAPPTPQANLKSRRTERSVPEWERKVIIPFMT
jgi:hypothetical protein